MSTEPEIVGKECRFAIHIPPKHPDVPDFHLVKEILHFKDGTTKPNTAFIRDYKRSFYVTKKQYQNHQQKKEDEILDKLHRYETTQSNLRNAVAKALGIGWSNAQYRQLASSPYLYGSDISSTALIKQDYRDKYPDAVSPYSVAFFDIETDVVHGTDDPIMATIVYKDKIFTAILESAVQGHFNPLDTLRKLLHEHLGTYIEKYHFEVEFKIAKDPVELIKESISRAHQWSPDFLAIWNINFDIPRVLDTLKKYNVDPADIFSDPRLSPELRFCKYKKGSTKKITASGQVKPKNPSEQWHSLYCPASFFVIDAMCTYRFVRQGEQELPYYSLDYVLEHNLGVRKLNFNEASEVEEGSLDWHIFMQSKYMLHYVIYNIFDCIGMYLLEEKNNDLSQSLPAQSFATDFSHFNSQTKKFADKYHFFVQRYGCVIGTIGQVEKKAEETDPSDPEVDDEEDDEFSEFTDKDDVLSLRRWIVTLPSHLSALGQSVIEESDQLLSQVRMMVYDIDAVSAYPSCASVANVSRETTSKEIIDIVGIPEDQFRVNNMNILEGHVNALEYGNKMHQLPTPQQSLSLFDDLICTPE